MKIVNAAVASVFALCLTAPVVVQAKQTTIFLYQEHVNSYCNITSPSGNSILSKAKNSYCKDLAWRMILKNQMSLCKHYARRTTSTSLVTANGRAGAVKCTF